MFFFELGLSMPSEVGPLSPAGENVLLSLVTPSVTSGLRERGSTSPRLAVVSGILTWNSLLGPGALPRKYPQFDCRQAGYPR